MSALCQKQTLCAAAIDYLVHHMETCRAQVAAPRCVVRRANEEKSHGNKHRFLSVRCDRGWDHFYRRPFSLGAFIGGCGIRRTRRHRAAFAGLSSTKGIRDIASGLFAAIPIVYGSAYPLGWFMLAATIIPITDATIVLQQGGSRAVAFGVHGSTAA